MNPHKKLIHLSNKNTNIAKSKEENLILNHTKNS